ncbi:hypothetical protein A2X44_00855 [candidate division CPR3 bacterium GWF2_35_18]|uniref:Benzoate 1,2-dioxygenase electron transfer protein n=1 Tax=candidate division CPR3 bacterium GW2011_GWF2_35_18 TaxID=1618350 RepID=A0A0G0ESC7_UNCC3|nr:MAG: Benzoate 1,2-dioxygenase electron transfer protein [candidate division CPR3 bacterium GW2011_GWF2_35_18]OGB63455.1 MAG: hypothetical protein A2X44_00855 [candidate division CPR3 bacterium GWF2_35_18]OGB64799.1 MAG: hypothetical protein A2250_05170 [candidate division CPR3 bacterium RIFOXYA2_FULL_35_13]OGB76902.1 MAG: hypothetical protein A2476_02320 [candidate division CPR3 bacterium RIFOXYC2_FULL_35_7]OGB78573.1 MAG: hypothetical protein A2296_01460 [candidate division CPR3 bacterium R
MQQFEAILESKQILTPTVLLVRFQNLNKIDFIPGQFITIPIGKQNRFYSLATTPLFHKYFELIATVENNGVGANFLLNQLKIGEKVTFYKPQGKFNLQNNSKAKIFLATGVGISAIRSMIQTLVQTDFQKQFLLFFGIKTKKDVFLENEWQNIQDQNSNFSYFYCLSREKNKHYNFGYVSGNLKEYLTTHRLNPQDFEYYVCGNLNNVQNIVEFLQNDLGISNAQVFFEKFI